jgi:hypothetical protein
MGRLARVLPPVSSASQEIGSTQQFACCSVVVDPAVLPQLPRTVPDEQRKSRRLEHLPDTAVQHVVESHEAALVAQSKVEASDLSSYPDGHVADEQCAFSVQQLLWKSACTTEPTVISDFDESV